MKRCNLILCGALLAFAWGVGHSLAQRDETTEEEQKLIAKWRLELSENKSDLKKLARQRLDAARKNVEARFSEFATGRTTVADYLISAHRHWMDAELLVAVGKEQRITALENCWILAKKAEALYEPRFKAGTIGPANYYPIVVMRSEVEYALVKAMRE